MLRSLRATCTVLLLSTAAQGQPAADTPVGIVDDPCPPAVVFMGDSITENWLLGDPALFGTTRVNRGIGGQTTPQMLLRFRADVIALRPRAVHIMAGTNDIAGNTGPSTLLAVKNNLISMVELAKANGIEVLLGSIPPAGLSTGGRASIRAPSSAK